MNFNPINVITTNMRDTQHLSGPAAILTTFISPWELYYIRVIAWN